MEKIKTDIKYKTFELMQMNCSKKLAEIKVPDGVVFHLSMGHIMGTNEDRDTYNFLAIIPYDRDIYEFLIHQNIDCNVYNIFDVYISWIIKDSVPKDFNIFPFTTADLNIEPFYIKTLSVDQSKKNKMYIDLMTEIYNRDGKYPSREKMLEIEKRCTEEISTISGYIKVIDISFSGVRAVHINYVPTLSMDSGIIKQYITYNDLLLYENMLTIESEFNNAVGEILQDFNIL